MYEVTPEILRDAARAILNSKRREYMCRALAASIDGWYEFGEVVDQYDAAYGFLHPLLRESGIPTDGSWLDDEEISTSEWNRRRYEYLMDVAARLELGCI